MSAQQRGRVTVFTVPLRAARIGLIELLDERERTRIARCATDSDRGRMLLGAVLLRAAAGSLLGKSLTELRVDRTCTECDRQHGRRRTCMDEI